VNRICAGLLALLLLSGAAEAHRLKIFVTVEDGALSGHAFFVGGGRPEGVDFIVKASGQEVFRGKTDSAGGFRWKPETPADYTVTVDAGDGHRVEAAVAAERLGGPPTQASQKPPEAQGCAPGDSEALTKIVEAQVDRAVARQLRPLMEAYTQAEARVRFNDVMGGVGMIVGLAGAGLWASARRRAKAPAA
jgi:nickel transport protein